MNLSSSCLLTLHLSFDQAGCYLLFATHLALVIATSLFQYVDEVGQSFYRIQPQAGPSGLLAGLLQVRGSR